MLDIDAPRVRELSRALTERFPALGPHLAHFAVAIDGEIYSDAPYHPLEHDSEVYFIPRIAGGCPPGGSRARRHPGGSRTHRHPGGSRGPV